MLPELSEKCPLITTSVIVSLTLSVVLTIIHPCRLQLVIYIVFELKHGYEAMNNWPVQESAGWLNA